MSIDIKIIPLNIPINTAQSAAEEAINGTVPVAIITPALWDAATISFLIQDHKGGAFYPLYDTAGVEVNIPSASISTTEARRFALDPRLFLGVYAMRIRSGISSAEVPQTTARTIQVVVRHVD